MLFNPQSEVTETQPALRDSRVRNDCQCGNYYAVATTLR